MPFAKEDRRRESFDVGHKSNHDRHDEQHPRPAPQCDLAETESFAIIEVREPDGLYYDLELGMVTVHLTEDEYEEFIELVKQLKIK